MSKTVWLINLPDDAKVLVETGQDVPADEVLAEKDDRKIKAPTSGKVAEVEEERIKFEFKTTKIAGQGLNKFHNWGIINWQPEISYGQLDYDYRGQILVVKAENLTPHLVSKARTLGVKGIIVFGDKAEEKDWPIPILVVDKKQAKLIRKREGVKCLLDTSKDCLLIPEMAKG